MSNHAHPLTAAELETITGALVYVPPVTPPILPPVASRTLSALLQRLFDGAAI